MTRNECQKETRKHIKNVDKFIYKIIDLLKRRAKIHDESKLENPELDIFTEFTPKLANSTYGSEEYKGFLSSMNQALTHHYQNNRHHPEHFKNGIDDMNLIDIVEMICDWKAATLRHNDGDLLSSIEVNQLRFNYDKQLKSIFINTAKLLYKYMIEYSCVDGRSGFYCADTKDKLFDKIDSDRTIDDDWKDIFKYGYFREFLDKEYKNSDMTIDNGLWIKWTVN